MNFEPSAYLCAATSRAKSDVANKLVSMFLHEISRRVAAEIGLGVTAVEYANSVTECFSDKCGYCGRILEKDRVAVEHLDGMNRFRVGLHIPGNVILSCKRCNGEKRRDDTLQQLVLAESGWESFLSHNSRTCAVKCKTCLYWKALWPDDTERSSNLELAKQRILAFRARYPISKEWSRRAHIALKGDLEVLYRDCQQFAFTRIEAIADKLFEQVRAS